MVQCGHYTMIFLLLYCSPFSCNSSNIAVAIYVHCSFLLLKAIEKINGTHSAIASKSKKGNIFKERNQEKKQRTYIKDYRNEQLDRKK